jgi:hypothetical protein
MRSKDLQCLDEAELASVAGGEFDTYVPFDDMISYYPESRENGTWIAQTNQGLYRCLMSAGSLDSPSNYCDRIDSGS